MNDKKKSNCNYRILLPLLAIIILLLILGGIFIPDILGIIVVSFLFFAIICLPCALAFFVHADFFHFDDKKGIAQKAAAGLVIVLFGAVFAAILIMAVLQGVTILFTRALCPVGFTSITAKQLSIPYEDKDDNNRVHYRKTVEVTANNEDFFYKLDEFPVFACIVLFYFLIAFCIVGLGFIINTLCLKKGKPARRFLFIPVAYAFILLLVFIPQPVSDFFHYGIRGILYRGWTPLLHNAAGDTNTGFLEELIRQGARINTRDKYGNTPLFAAVEEGNLVMVQALLVRGARQNFKNREGNTPLMIAVMKNKTEILRLLLANGARVSIKNKQGKTALELARYEEKTEILEVFRQEGYNEL